MFQRKDESELVDKIITSITELLDEDVLNVTSINMLTESYKNLSHAINVRISTEIMQLQTQMQMHRIGAGRTESNDKKEDGNV